MSIQTHQKSSDEDTASSSDEDQEEEEEEAPEEVVSSGADAENVAPVWQAEYVWMLDMRECVP